MKTPAPDLSAASPAIDRRPRLLAFLLFAVTAAVFAAACRNGFVNYDDPDYVTSNAHIRAGLNAATLCWALSATAASNWHPLTWLSHALDVSLFGLRPAGHHAMNVLLHSVNAALAFLAIRRLTRRVGLSFAVALLFAVHPLRVESVAWVAERKDVLSGGCFFLTLWAYARHVETRRAAEPVARGGSRWYIAALLFFALGLLAKPMLVTVPCVLLLLDYWPLQRFPGPASRVSRLAAKADRPADAARLELAGAPRSGGTRTARATVGPLVLEKVPFFALSLASATVTFFVQKQGGAVTTQLPWAGRIENALVAIPRYVGKIVWPANLSALYPHPGFWSAGYVALAAAFVVAVSWVTWRTRQSRPWLLAGWLWFVGMLVPVIGLVQVGLQSIADRYTYLPAIGLELAAIWTIADVVGRKRLIAVACVGIAPPLAVATVRQVAVWHDSLALFTQAIAVAGRGNYLAYDNRGIAWADRGDLEAAIADYRRSLAINRDYPNAHNNLGLALSKLGRYDEAIAEYRTALKEKPSELDAHTNLANALSDVGRLDEALAEFRYVLERAPRHVNALNGEAVIFAQRGDLPKAERQFKRALDVDPANLGALTNLGNVYAMTGRREDAIRAFTQALARKPDDPVVLFNLGQLYLQLGRLPEAAEKLGAAARLNPRNADCHFALGTVLAQLGRTASARAELERCLQLRPGDAPAQSLLQKLRD